MASTKVRIKMVPGFERVLGRTLGVRIVENRVAERAADIARATAPVDTGGYRDSIAVERDGDTVQLVSRDFKAHWIEWGSAHNRAHATLRNAARSTGARVVDT